jgi:hypothetical protein
MKEEYGYGPTWKWILFVIVSFSIGMELVYLYLH